MAPLVPATPALVMRADYAAGYSGGNFPSNGGSVSAFVPEIGNSMGNIGTAPTYQNSGGPNSKPFLRFVAGALQAIDDTFLQNTLDGCWTAVMVYRVNSPTDVTQIMFAKATALNQKGIVGIGQTALYGTDGKLIWGTASANQGTTYVVADSTWRVAVIVGRGTIGSSGQTTTPGRVYKGKRMAGHMGSDRVTSLNIRVVLVDGERNILAVRGSVPGAKGTVVIIKEHHR